MSSTNKRKTENSLPGTPTKIPVMKKGKIEDMDGDMATSIVAQLTRAIEKQGKVINERFEEVQRSINFIAAEVKEMKTDLKMTTDKVKKNEERIQKVEIMALENSRYIRRWNLRLHGLEETEGEDVRAKVISICQSVAPAAKERFPEVIDTVHRLGRKNNPNKPREGPRAVILHFSMRHFRDMIWKESKNHHFLQQRHLRFKEDLSQEDRVNREKLWPLVQKARQEKKMAYFVGGRAFVNGREIVLPTE